MDFEVCTIPGCPHTDPAAELFAVALDLEGAGPAALTLREITTDDDAGAWVFHGSPTFTIEGVDLFPVDTDPAVTCRVYQTPQGLSGLPDFVSLRGPVRTVLARTASTA